MNVLGMFGDVDDFLLCLAPQWRANRGFPQASRKRTSQFHPPEEMTILIFVRLSHDRTVRVYDTE